MKKFFLLLLSFSFSITLLAVKAYPGLLTYTQPDGTTINYYLYGDENFSYMVSEDGYLLTFDEFHVLRFADFDGANILPSQQRVKANVVDFTLSNIVEYSKNKLYSSAQRASSNKGYPLTGSPKSLVILVNFSDVAFSSASANQDFTNLLNRFGYAENGATGSARDYFRRASNNAFDPNFVVVGPYTLPHDRKFYGEQDGDNVDKRPGNMIVDACDLADKDIDFSEFDENGDGYIDNVFVYYAGHNQAEGGGTNTVWPHRSYISDKNNIKYDGVQLGDYACTSELRSSSGKKMCGIGTFVHEFGHVLSLPDLYDTQYSGHQTLGSWDVMDNGSYNNNGRTPPTYSAYERFYLGWLIPAQLIGDTRVELEPLAISNAAYLVCDGLHNMDGVNPHSKEFFMLENRSTDYHDGVPAEGLLITRIVYNSRDWEYNVVNNNKRNMGVEICCASGTTKSPRSNVFPGSQDVTTFDFELRSGFELDKSLSQITKKDSLISFVWGEIDFMPNLFFTGDDMQSFSAFVGEEQTKILNIKGSRIGEHIYLFLYKGDYTMRLAGSDAEFGNELSVMADADSLVDFSVEIKYAPKVCTYSNSVFESLYIVTKNYEKPITLKGYSPRPIYVKVPLAREAEDVSPYTFTAVWDSVFDAREYLLSVYSVSNSDTLFVLKDSVVVACDSEKMTCDVRDLQADCDYKYRVRASDRDPAGRYENITDYSNEILVTTLSGFGADSRKLDVLRDGDKYVVYLPIVDENHSIFIYSIDGHLITSIPVITNIVDIPQLKSNSVYILKYASNDGLKRKSKVIKLYYK